MRRLKVSRQARQDLKEIVRYVARDKPAPAHRLRESLEVAFGLLAREPLIGEAREDLGTDVRMFPVANCVILFTGESDTFSAVTIVTRSVSEGMTCVPRLRFGLRSFSPANSIYSSGPRNREW